MWPHLRLLKAWVSEAVHLPCFASGRLPLIHLRLCLWLFPVADTAPLLSQRCCASRTVNIRSGWSLKAWSPMSFTPKACQWRCHLSSRSRWSDLSGAWRKPGSYSQVRGGINFKSVFHVGYQLTEKKKKHFLWNLANQSKYERKLFLECRNFSLVVSRL